MVMLYAEDDKDDIEFSTGNRIGNNHIDQLANILKNFWSKDKEKVCPQIRTNA
jgi:hypothetical protein